MRKTFVNLTSTVKLHLRKQLILILCFIAPIASWAQVSSSDISHFGQNLNIRREKNVAINPHSSDFLQVPFGELDYKGIKAVSTKLLFNAYPDENPVLVNGLFTTIGLDKVVFDKFIFQIFLYSEGDKHTTIGLINAFCDNMQLTNRIYEGYTRQYKNKLATIKRTHQEDEQTENIGKTFSIPVNTHEKVISSFKDKDISTITFTARGVQYQENGGQPGVDINIKYEISIKENTIELKCPYRDGYMSEDYVIDSTALDNESQSQMFFLKSGEQVRRNSFMNPAKVEYMLKLYWNAQSGYAIELKALKRKEFKIFVNEVRVKD